MKRLRGRDDTTWLALGFVVLALVAVAVAAWQLADNQSDQRRDLRERYADRVDVATALIGSLFTVAFNGSRENAAERLATPSRERLDALARRSNWTYAVVLDPGGRVLASSTRTPPGTERRLAARPAFVRRALAPGATGASLGDARPGDVVESAVSFPARGATRVLVTASPQAAFRDFLAGTLRPLPQGSGGRGYVFDRNGALLAFVSNDGRPPPRLLGDVVRRALREPMGSFRSATGEQRFFAARAIPGSDWHVVAGLPESTLYASASGTSRWLPWVILALGGAALIGVALLLRRLLLTRSRLRRANTELSDSRVRLQERADELERSNADLEQFAYAASHDLSEPLRTVAGFSQLLRSRYRGRLDSDADVIVAEMGAGVDRMQQLIDDLLLYSRVGRAPLHADPVDLADVVDEARSRIGPAVDEREARISTDDLPTVRGERGQLTQVFQNLLGNAVKFTAPGVTPEVHVSAAQVNGDWRIAVADNGIGVDPDKGDAIFKMFGRLHPSDHYPGTGIGLALVKRIVERHGGRIWVEPGPAGGSVFVFTLPARAGRHTRDAPSEAVRAS